MEFTRQSLGDYNSYHWESVYSDNTGVDAFLGQILCCLTAKDNEWEKREKKERSQNIANVTQPFFQEMESQVKE